MYDSHTDAQVRRPGAAPPSANGQPVEASWWDEVRPYVREGPSWLAKGVTLFAMFLFAWPVVSEGLRLAYPVMGQRLHRQPGLGVLKHYEGFHRADPAHLTAAALLVAVCWLWTANIRLRMAWARPKQIAERWDPAVYRRLVQALAGVLLAADSLLFFYGASHQAAGSWDAAGVPFVAGLLLTVGYVAFTVLAAFWIVTLDPK